MADCPLCGGKKPETAPSLPKTGLVLSRCGHCGLVALEVEDRVHYAKAVQQEFFEEEAGGRDWLERRFGLHQAHRRLKEILRHKSFGRLLEIGSGWGDFLAVAARRGFNCLGVDPSPMLAEAARRRSGVSVLCGEVQDLVMEARFDVVVMSHVLEHVTDPREVLGRLRSFLNPDGVLYIAVPNIGSWEARFSGWTSYQPYHLFYFSPASLRRTLEAAAFEIVESYTFEPFSGWLNAALRTAFRDSFARPGRGRQACVDPGREGNLLKFVLNVARVAFGAATFPLRRVQAALGRGEELVAIARPTGRI